MFILKHSLLNNTIRLISALLPCSCLLRSTLALDNAYSWCTTSSGAHSSAADDYRGAACVRNPSPAFNLNPSPDQPASLICADPTKLEDMVIESKTEIGPSCCAVCVCATADDVKSHLLSLVLTVRMLYLEMHVCTENNRKYVHVCLVVCLFAETAAEIS